MNLSARNNKSCGVCITDPRQLILMSPQKAKDCSDPSCILLQTICALPINNGDSRIKKCQEAAEKGIEQCSMCPCSHRQRRLKTTH